MPRPARIAGCRRATTSPTTPNRSSCAPRARRRCRTPNTSMRFGPQDTALGDDESRPPSHSQPDQPLPVYARCQSAPSPPRAKMSIRPDAQLATSGSDVRKPPSGLHALVDDVVCTFCHNCPSAPRTNTSSRLAAGDAIPGPKFGPLVPLAGPLRGPLPADVHRHVRAELGSRSYMNWPGQSVKSRSRCPTIVGNDTTEPTG